MFMYVQKFRHCVVVETLRLPEATALPAFTLATFVACCGEPLTEPGG